MKRVTLLLVLAVLLLAGARTQADLTEILSGKRVPLTMKMSELDSEWRRFTVAPEANGPSVFTDAMYASRAQDAGIPPVSTYYTRGWTHEFGGETYLIAYQTKSMLTTIAAMVISGNEDTEKLLVTPDTELAMSLLNLRTMGSMKDIRPFSLDEEIAESRALFGEEEYSSGEEVSADGSDPEVARSSSNLHQIGLALGSYMSDYDDKLPPMKDSAQTCKLLEQYARSRDVFTDPMTGDLYAINTILSLHKLAHIQYPQDMAVFYEAVPRGDGTIAVLFLDGHVARLCPEEWPDVRKKSKIP